MNKYLLHTFLSVICLATLLVACNDNDEPDGPKINGIYSNKLSAPEDGNTLALTYSGREFIGKDVTFKLLDEHTANITLQGILPGETATLLENIPLSAEGDSYSFSGNGTGNNGTTFAYTGKVETRKMTLALTAVKVASNPLTANGKWYPLQTGGAFHLVTDNPLLAQTAPLLEPMLSNLITWFINEVTFLPDGNITARYAKMPEGKAIGDLINSAPDRKESEWLTSPINLASYYVKDDSQLYIVPNIDMILYQLQQNKTRADEGPDLALIAAIYQQLNKWSTTGIRMNIRKNTKTLFGNQGKAVANEGDIFLFLDKEEIAVFLSLLPLVKDLLPEDMLNGTMGPIISSLLDMIVENLQQAQTLELGLMLTEEKR